ncbi:MAG: sulfurtransferase [Burkholderiales bacterium]|nr:sulfurtransferase [Burkholderiales bacterium]MCA3227962.1 sulfurtransferase [Burkholderiales bacterium]
MKTLTAAELAHWLADAQRARPQLVDVREPWETQLCRIAGAALMPMREVPQRFADLDPEQPVVCFCHHGARSAHVAMFLARQGYGDVYNLTGGIDAWARQIDPAMATY